MDHIATNVKELPLLDRPREKLLHTGAASLDNTELLAILFGSGNKNMPVMSICQTLVSVIDNDPRQLCGIDIDTLQQVKGIGEVKAIIVLAALELGKRAVGEAKPLVLKEDSAVDEFITPYLDRKDRLQYFLVLLNHRHELLATNELTVEEGQLPELKPIIKLSLEAAAAGFIICRRDLQLPENFINKEKAFIIQLDAAASMLKIKMRGLLLVDND